MNVLTWDTKILNLVLRQIIRARKDGENGERETLLRVTGKEISREEDDAMQKVLRVREALAADSRLIEVQDFGTGGNQEQSVEDRRVSAIYRSSAVPHRWGFLLFRLARVMRPNLIIELGTNLGVSAAYLQAALDLNGNGGRLITLEGSPALARIAATTVASACSARPEIVVGRFSEMLPSILNDRQEVDLAFIDGHHAYEPTLRYFEILRERLSAHAAIVFDDVYFWSRPVRRAWIEIVRGSRGWAIDFAKIGILFPYASEPDQTKGDE